MQEIDGNKYRAVLIAKRQEALQGLHKREDIWIVQTAEQVETVQLAGERDFAVRILDRQGRMLRQVEAALARIDDGEFGICVDCGEPISPKRIAAVPWAAYCLKCQELRDAHQEQNAGELDSMLAA